MGHMRFVWLLLLAMAAGAATPKKIVILAGRKSHPPGAREYLKSAKLLKVMLERSTPGARVELHFNGWPENAATLDTADSLVTISDGQDGHLGSPVPFMTPERMAIIERQMKRGCGFGLIHFSTFAPDAYGPQKLAWSGGYFDWQDDTGARHWYSAIKTLETRVEPATPGHPALRGIAPFDLKEEFYYQIRFPRELTGWKPLLRVPALGGNRGPEFDVTVTEDPNQLAHLDGYQLLVLHYANWTSPGLPDAAKAGLVGYLKRGGGLAVIHFANGAFHHSLPKSPGTASVAGRSGDCTASRVGSNI